MSWNSLAWRKRLGGLALMMLVIAPLSVTAFPRPAHALFGIGDIVFDPVAYAKDLGLDNIGWVIAKTAIASMQRSLVNWINSGFEGSPAFVTDLKRNLVGVGDAVVARVVSQVAGDVTRGLIVDSPYQDEIATAIRTGYYLSTGGTFYVRNPFTLGQYSTDPRSFLEGRFDEGGLAAWHSAITTCQNNPHCAYQLAMEEVDKELAAAGGERLTELNWGDGFLSFRGTCRAYTSAKDAVTSMSQGDNCVGKPVRTPGTVIASQLNEALPKGMEGLVTADEIDEVIGALLQQLVNKVIGSTGLLGVSAPSSGGGRPFIDQATDPNAQKVAPTAIDPEIEARLSAFEASWNTISIAAGAAIEKCPSAAVATQAVGDSLTALARADAARKALSAGASNDLAGDLIPTAAEVADAQSKASGAEGSLKQQLDAIRSSRTCPSN